MSVIRSSETVRQHRVLTALIHSCSSHAASTTVTIVGNVNLDFLPEGFHFGVLVNGDLFARSYLFPINFPGFKLLGVIRSSEGAFKQGIFTALLQGLARHFTTAAIGAIGNFHLDVLPNGFYSGVFLYGDFSACSVLSITNLPGLELFVFRSGKSIIQNLVL